MKVVKYLISIVALAAVLPSCKSVTDIFLPDTPPTYVDYYFLNAGFKNGEGIDLVAPLGEEYYKSDKDKTIFEGEVNPEKYSLELETYTGSQIDTPHFTVAKFDAQHSMLKTRNDGTYIGDGTWYLGCNLVYGSAGGRLPLQQTLTYKVKCPTVFSDDSVHVIETHWVDDIQKGEYTRYPRCTKATIDGRDITPAKGISYNDNTDNQYSAFFLDIVLQ